MMNQQQITPEQLQANLAKANNVINHLLQKIANVELQNSSLQVDLEALNKYAAQLEQELQKVQEEKTQEQE